MHHSISSVHIQCPTEMFSVHAKISSSFAAASIMFSSRSAATRKARSLICRFVRGTMRSQHVEVCSVDCPVISASGINMSEIYSGVYPKSNLCCYGTVVIGICCVGAATWPTQTKANGIVSMTLLSRSLRWQKSHWKMSALVESTKQSFQTPVSVFICFKNMYGEVLSVNFFLH